MSRSDCPSPGAPKPTPPVRCAPRKNGGWACRAATARHPELAQKRAVLCSASAAHKPRNPFKPTARSSTGYKPVLRQQGAHLARMEDGHVAQRLPVNRSLPRSVLCSASAAHKLHKPHTPVKPTARSSTGYKPVLRQSGAHLARMEDGHVAQRLPVTRSPQANSASKVRTSQGWRMGMSRSDCPSTGAPKPTPPAKCAPRKDGGWACRAATARHPEPTSSTTPSSQPHAHRRATSPSSASKVRTSQPPPTSQPPTATATSNRPRPICERPQCPAL